MSSSASKTRALAFLGFMPGSAVGLAIAGLLQGWRMGVVVGAYIALACIAIMAATYLSEGTFARYFSTLTTEAFPPVVGLVWVYGNGNAWVWTWLWMWAIMTALGVAGFERQFGRLASGGGGISFTLFKAKLLLADRGVHVAIQAIRWCGILRMVSLGSALAFALTGASRPYVVTATVLAFMFGMTSVLVAWRYQKELRRLASR